VVVPTLEAGVQLETVRLATELLDNAADPSNTVFVVAGPLVSAKVPEQVPLTVSVVEKPLAVSLAIPARISKEFVDETGPLAPPPPPPPQAVRATDITKAKSFRMRMEIFQL
jgi:hypothetical protein